MIITDKTEWLHPVRLRINGKVRPSRNVGVVFERIIASGTSWNEGLYATKHPDMVIGFDICLAGIDEPENGRLEWWLKNDMGLGNTDPFVYFVFVNVKWNGSFGESDHRGGFVFTKTNRSGWRQYRSFSRMLDAKK